MLISRSAHHQEVAGLLREVPVVAILGARQVGKTTLARSIARRWRGPSVTFDLEDPRDVARLADPMLALSDLTGLVVLDEIQHRPELFPSLRVLADRRPTRTRFLVLGSASPELVRRSAESLAGRIAYLQLPPLTLDEVGPARLERLWRRGGFPRSFVARTEASSSGWRRQFVATFLERDLPELGFRTPPSTIRRFWGMLAHYHGQTLNSSELARAFGVADTTIRRHLETLEATFVIRLLRPYHANLAKRQVKAPKVYIADSGLLHTLLALESQDDIEGHPKVGASWEGFLLENVCQVMRARPDQCYFWATHGGAELDLLVIQGSKRIGFEFKRNTAPSITPAMRSALTDLALSRLYVVHAGTESFALDRRVEAVAAARITRDLPRAR
ncbi:MAG: ATP-binding protein [Gemmatimonadaceae bacterium]|nr:ATP-binding protein [Gemmatimonadaceae bacterium]